MDDIKVHIRVKDKEWKVKKDLAHEIAELINEHYPHVSVYVFDTEEP